MGIKVANNAFATLATGITSSATSITVASGQGARFPSLGALDYFYATLINTSNQLEIVKCTARSGDVLTVVRAQEGTTARAYDVGDRIEIRITAATFEDATAIYDVPTDSTGSFSLPVGTTAERPANPEAGMMRFNTDRGFIEWYDPVANLWTSTAFDIGTVATGGTVTDITQDGAQYRVHTFTTAGTSTFTVTRGGTVEYLVVAGGGGGGGGIRTGTNSGGGGAGYREGAQLLSPGAYSVTVGAGGAGGVTGGGSQSGSSGGSSVFSSFTAGGGGGGAGTDQSVNAGGIGASSGTGDGAVFSGGAGFGGGGDVRAAGGGGGSAQTGGNASSDQGGNGGNGIQRSISGVSTYYGGGGGGWAVGGQGSGGLGGGGSPSSSQTVNGVPNSGGGGGGRRTGDGDGGTGGSGIVIVRYRIG